MGVLWCNVYGVGLLSFVVVNMGKKHSPVQQVCIMEENTVYVVLGNVFVVFIKKT